MNTLQYTVVYSYNIYGHGTVPYDTDALNVRMGEVQQVRLLVLVPARKQGTR